MTRGLRFRLNKNAASAATEAARHPGTAERKRDYIHDELYHDRGGANND